MNRFTASLWRDEAFSAVLSMKSIPEIIRIIAKDTAPPLFNLCEYFWFKMFGTSEVAIRSLSFLFYAISIFFVFLIVKLVWNKKTAILAAILAATNPFYFSYAFEGRMYSIMSLGVVASSYFFLKLLIQKKNNLGTSVGYVLATSWALYSHHFAIFSLIPQIVWFVKSLFGKDKQKSVLIFKHFIVAAVLYTPWLLPLYNQVKLVSGGFWLAKPTVKEFISLVSTYLSANINYDKMAIITVILLTAILALRKWREKTEYSLFLLASFLLPIMASFAISLVATPIFFDRYILYTIPFAMMLLATNTKKTGTIIVCILIVCYTLVDGFLFMHSVREPFAELSNYIKTNKQQNDIVINQTPTYIWESKYYGLKAPIYTGGQQVPFFFGTALLEAGDTVNQIPLPEKSTIYIIGDNNSPELAQAKSKTIKTSEVKEFGNLRLLILQTK